MWGWWCVPFRAGLSERTSAVGAEHQCENLVWNKKKNKIRQVQPEQKRAGCESVCLFSKESFALRGQCPRNVKPWTIFLSKTLNRNFLNEKVPSLNNRRENATRKGIFHWYQGFIQRVFYFRLAIDWHLALQWTCEITQPVRIDCSPLVECCKVCLEPVRSRQPTADSIQNGIRISRECWVNCIGWHGARWLFWNLRTRSFAWRAKM